MCLAKAYVEREGDRERLLEDVARIEIEGRRLRLSTLFGEEREIEGTLRAVDFQEGSLVIERAD